MDITILIISISNPIIIGIYKDDRLIKSIYPKGQTSEVLPLAIKDILDEYTIKNIIYVNGPGSYMSIKVSYLFLKTISIVHNINFFSLDGFSLNNNSPIKSLGNKYFILKNNIIEQRALKDNEIVQEFKLPPILDQKLLNKNTLPNYQLPCV